MKVRNRPVVREVVHSTDPALGKGHRLLRHNFPKSELVSSTEWRDSLREREARLWTDLRWHVVIAEAAGRVVGVVTGTYLGNINTGVIGYLAVSATARRLGIGPKLRAKLRAKIEGSLGEPTDLAEKVRYELSHSPRTWHLPQPEVEIIGGTAVLRGEVPHDVGRVDLERTAAAVSGVVQVENLVSVTGTNGHQ